MPIEPIYIRADNKKAQQAFLNVLSNAYKYSGPGTPVRLLVQTSANNVNLKIFDQGIGMTAEQTQRVCERFYRADTSGQVSGTGLGMSIVKEIMDLHQGRIDIESTPGQGTVVTLVFAQAPAPAASEACSESAITLWNP
jgi:signal transduction histidine kinase